MNYYCEFPGCKYVTDSRTQINSHHIVPRSKGGSNKASNRIWLCPTHHTKIYIPLEFKGIHSKYNDDSIILLRWALSSEGKILIYKPINSNEFLYY